MIETSSYHKTPDQIKEEEALIQKAIKNPHRFDVLYKKYFLQIYKYILQRCGDEFLADDITSQTFTKALTNLKKYQFKGFPFSAWLYRIASNELNDYYRKNGKVKTIQVEETQIGSVMDDLELEEYEQNIQKILWGLNKLNPDEIELVELKYFEKKGFKEIGAILDLTTDNARVKTHRVIKKLRKLLKD